MIDSLKHKGLRRKMIRKLMQLGIDNDTVLNAIYSIPRHFFLESVFDEMAYEIKAFPILSKQTISSPYTVAFQTMHLEVKKEDIILEIGTGSGYQSSVLLALGVDLVTIERQKSLYDFSKNMFVKLDKKPNVQIYGDGYSGFEEKAPYDKIIVTAGAPNIPKRLLIQLKIGGLLLIPVGEKEQRMLKIRRLSEKDFEETDLGVFKFVPLLKDKS